VIEVSTAELADVAAAAVMRPVAADFTPVTPLTRRLAVAAGAAVEEQCAQLGDLPLGSAAITGAGALPFAFMVHVAVRSVEEPVRPSTVRQALRNGFRRLAEWEIETVAMPLVGTGAGNLDAEEAVRIMLEVLDAHGTESSYPKLVKLVVDGSYEKLVVERALSGADPVDG